MRIYKYSIVLLALILVTACAKKESDERLIQALTHFESNEFDAGFLLLEEPFESSTLETRRKKLQDDWIGKVDRLKLALERIENRTFENIFDILEKPYKAKKLDARRLLIRAIAHTWIGKWRSSYNTSDKISPAMADPPIPRYITFSIFFVENSNLLSKNIPWLSAICFEKLNKYFLKSS